MKSRQNKKGKWMDKGITIVLIAFAIGVIALALFMIMNHISEKKKEEAAKEPAATATAAAATATPQVDESEITRYICVISKGTKDSEQTEFHMEFHDKTGTYRELLKTGDSTSRLSDGTFTKTKDSIDIVNNKGDKNRLLYDKDHYLVSQNALYEGDVPDSVTFNQTFSHDVDGVSSIRIKFHKNGTFSQRVVRNSAGSDSNGQTDTVDGTYKHKGRFIYCTQKDGNKLMPFYVYKNKLCASYYRKEEKRQSD